jgi:hypothetical protein
MNITKYALPARISIAGEERSILGVVYVRQDQRVIDMLCDPRPFFPVKTKEGVVLVSKAAVSTISILERADIEGSLDLYPGLDLATLTRREPAQGNDYAPFDQLLTQKRFCSILGMWLSKIAFKNKRLVRRASKLPQTAGLI